MAFAKNTIKLGAAKEVFEGVEIEEVKLGDRVAGYRATRSGLTLEDTSLTRLMRSVWQKSAGGSSCQ